MQENPTETEVRKGVVAAITAYVLWGLFPLFWKALTGIDSLELIAHRVVWSLLFVAAVCHQQKTWPEVLRAFRERRLLGLHLLSGGLLSINWLSYVWAVTHDRVLEASLGYYLVPLFNVVAGRFLLKERLDWLQVAAVWVAAIGVALQFTKLDSIPWLALTVAVSWGGYGLLRKRSPLGSLTGLTVETALYTPFAGAFLLWLSFHGLGALGHVGAWRTVLILCAGVVTAVPLLLFASGARRLKFSTLGLLQYIVPSMTFSLAVFVYREPVDTGKLLSFVLIWIALVLYTLAERRRRLRLAAA
jgi:chloramphenicol-sensitive protein RarD